MYAVEGLAQYIDVGRMTAADGDMDLCVRRCLAALAQQRQGQRTQHGGIVGGVRLRRMKVEDQAHAQSLFGS
jgi:hypothetical protein